MAKKEEYDWTSDDLRCTSCKKQTDNGAGIQFLDENNKCQRYCVKCYSSLLND